MESNQEFVIPNCKRRTLRFAGNLKVLPFHYVRGQKKDYRLMNDSNEAEPIPALAASPAVY
jgi:hypothetical protein